MHFIVKIDYPSNDPKLRKSLECTVNGDPDRFIKSYYLVKEGSEKANNLMKPKLYVSIKIPNVKHAENYFSNSEKLIGLVEKGSCEDLNTFFQ